VTPDTYFDRDALLAAGYTAPQAVWLLARSNHRGLAGEPILLPDQLERLLPDLPDDGDLEGDQ
jgi:hypothetical protein